MMRFGLLKCLKILVIVTAACAAFGFALMHLWNWLMPGLFGLRTITFAQALGLFLLSKLLFGGFHKHARGGRGWGRRGWQQRWDKMTPEERERFRTGMRGRCGFGKHDAPEEKGTA